MITLIQRLRGHLAINEEAAAEIERLEAKIGHLRSQWQSSMVGHLVHTRDVPRDKAHAIVEAQIAQAIATWDKEYARHEAL